MPQRNSPSTSQLFILKPHKIFKGKFDSLLRKKLTQLRQLQKTEAIGSLAGVRVRDMPDRGLQERVSQRSNLLVSIRRLNEPEVLTELHGKVEPPLVRRAPQRVGPPW